MREINFDEVSLNGCATSDTNKSCDQIDGYNSNPKGKIAKDKLPPLPLPQ